MKTHSGTPLSRLHATPVITSNLWSWQAPARRAIVTVFTAAVVTAGCTVGPDYRPPEPRVPDRWHGGDEGSTPAGKASVEQWWEVFDDPKLTDLIHRAADGNLDLRLAVLRIREARAVRGVAAGELLPVLGGSGSYQRSRSSANGPLAMPQAPGRAEAFADTVARGAAVSTLGTGLAAVAPNATGITNSVASGLVSMLPNRTGPPETDEVNLHATGFDASWEIDVFGGIRRNVEAADAAVQATIEDYRSTLVTLLAEVAITYVEIRTLQSQIEATTQNIQLQRETLGLTKSRLSLQLATELDVQQAETNLASTESALPLLQSGLAMSIYRLSVLLGQEPSALHGELTATQPIPQPPHEIVVGVPADILRQRPDIRSAERRLAEQTARIGVATADLYPRFTLAGTFGFESTNFNNLLDRGSIGYGFGPAFQWNIFDGLRNLNRIAAQEAVTHQSYIVYQRTLVVALQEVESSMVFYRREQVRRDALMRATEAAMKSVKLSETLYRNGLTDFQDVLDAQRSLANLENTLAQSRGQVAVNLVSLYKALGGGWSPGVHPQYEYLHYPDAVRHPADFFLTGGKAPLPWDTPSQAADETH